ncbi:hypothetical protein Hanom_Chr05g00398401 [Helianthus anomalus]
MANNSKFSLQFGINDQPMTCKVFFLTNKGSPLYSNQNGVPYIQTKRPLARS